ncbi:MAG: electron transport complex subunit RsxC [Clostridia bacterium]|nr:electron transport complex subunit RsxC [Clostridia bacterium]
MFGHSFLGGVHPKDGKKLSASAAIESYVPKGELVYLMNQHIGAPASPVVKAGDRVLVGQTIAEPGGFVSAPVVSSVSGTVKAVGPHICQNGDTALSVTVVNDGLYETTESFGVVRDFRAMTQDEIKKAILDAGIVGMGGAGFPTHVKLAVKPGMKIDYILCNGAECEPYITCDYRLMLERPEKAVLGMLILLSLFPDASGVFGIEDNKKDGIASVRKAVEQADNPDHRNVSVVSLKKKYPQGGERMLISAITGRKINSKQLPADAGCIVVNFSTLIAVAEAVAEQKPLIHRVVTITGDAVSRPSNFDAPIGTNISELIEAAGGFKTDPEKIISGGPMMGAAIYTLDIPVNKTTSCILSFTKDELGNYEPQECIRCGKCLTTCPERLMPIKLKNAADVGDYEEFEKLHGLECIGCGCCTFICPAKRKLSQSITAAKNHVLAEKKARAKKA